MRIPFVFDDESMFFEHFDEVVEQMQAIDWKYA